MRSRWRRALAALVGLWFTASVSGLALQFCPQHGNCHAMAGMHHTGADCAPAGDHGPSHHGQRHDGSPHDDCTCSGMCCVTGVVTLAAGRLIAIPVVPVEVAVVATPPMRTLAPRATPDVSLPPPLGPPSLRA